MQGVRSEWTTIIRGVTQGSVLDPCLFNIFINDLFIVLMCSNIDNYAGDNHICYKTNLLKSCDVLRLYTNIAFGWFEQNYMGANTNTFQGIILGKDVPLSPAGSWDPFIKSSEGPECHIKWQAQF